MALETGKQASWVKRRSWEGEGKRGEKRPGGWEEKEAGPREEAGEHREGSGEAEGRSGCAALACPLTLMHCDIAAVPVAVDERVLGPAPLVGAHAAAADHLLHATGELTLQ